MIPPWLPLRVELPGRDVETTAVRDALAAGGPVGIHGPPGSGRTSVAGAVLARVRLPVLAVSLVGCEDDADVVRALGEALAVRPAGDERAVEDALRQRGEGVFLAEDVRGEAVAAAVARLVALAPGLRLLVVSDEALLPGSVEIRPGGWSALERVAADMGLSDQEAARRLGELVGWLVPFPMGVPGEVPAGIPASAFYPDLLDRVVLRAGVAARLVPPEDAPVRVLERLRPLLALGQGAHLAGAPDYRDFLLLRSLSRMLPDPERARCIGAAVRLALCSGQLHVASSLCRADPSGDEAAGILAWAEGDLYLASGDRDDALARYTLAHDRFRRADLAALQATLLRRTGDRLAARGDVQPAAEAFRQARALYRAFNDPIGMAATLRGAAQIAVSSGEWVSAGALHEQVEENLGGAGGLEGSNLRVEQAALSLVRGDLAAAERALQEVAAQDCPLLRANVLRRQADIRLRRGDHEAARTAAETAGGLYAALGEAVAHGACARLAGDAAAVAGRPSEAMERYRRALALQVRARDWGGLSRTLAHAAAVADDCGATALAARLREQRAEVVRVGP
jgi:tetratricopeptide (TPR) repeat protein